MTPRQRLDTQYAKARQAVLRRLAARADYWAEEEQILVMKGHYAEAEGAHFFGLWCLRSYQAEADDPDPIKVES
jgi:hypothetical protein